MKPRPHATKRWESPMLSSCMAMVGNSSARSGRTKHLRFISRLRRSPDYWLSHAGLARVYSSKGDFENATKQMEMALAGAPDQAKTGVQGLIKRLQAKQDINQ